MFGYVASIATFCTHRKLFAFIQFRLCQELLLLLIHFITRHMCVCACDCVPLCWRWCARTSSILPSSIWFFIRTHTETRLLVHFGACALWVLYCIYCAFHSNEKRVRQQHYECECELGKRGILENELEKNAHSRKNMLNWPYTVPRGESLIIQVHHSISYIDNHVSLLRCSEF